MHHNIMKMCQLLLIQYKMKQCLRKYDMIVVLLFWLFFECSVYYRKKIHTQRFECETVIFIVVERERCFIAPYTGNKMAEICVCFL